MTDDESSGVQSINDGKLEVVALYSSFHMAQLQVGLSKPYRIGQANTVKVLLKFQQFFKNLLAPVQLYIVMNIVVIQIKLLRSCAMQVDGEPWYQNPCEFNITYCNQASMLMSNDF